MEFNEEDFEVEFKGLEGEMVMKLKCKICGWEQEVTEEKWDITQNGFPSGLPVPLDRLPVHPYTCCGQEMVRV